MYHLPVMPEQTINMLAVKSGGVYLDGTAGGGGHSALIAERLYGGSLFCVDRDSDALTAAGDKLKRYNNITIIRGNFHDVKALLEERGITALDGALLDLGVSSHQLDDAERGFSFHQDAALDMRMDATGGLTAADIVNEYSEEALTRILWEYGEERWARNIARVIRDRRPINTTMELVDAIDAAIPAKVRQKDTGHPARRAFMALRIAVNDELAPLPDALKDIVSMLNSGGRLCVITFHSLEDRIAKHTFQLMEKPCICPRNAPICVCGRVPMVKVLKKLKPDDVELDINPRARSATLRTVEKL